MSVLAHRVVGSGRPVLLLNGGLMSYGAWGPVADALAPTRTVVLCDLRGQLLSPGPPPARLSDHVDDVVALLDHLGLPEVDVIGASFGGEVALYLAALRPERVSALLAVTVVDRFTPEMMASGEPLARLCQEIAAGGDRTGLYARLMDGMLTPAWSEAHAAEMAQREAVVTVLPGAWFAGVAGLLASLGTVDLGPLLGRVRCPTRVVAAELDRLMPPERTRAVADGVPGATLEVLRGTGHAVLLEDPGALVALCRDFARP